MFLVQDWPMKFMPRKFREPQSDWFAKRGLPWHITVAIRKSEESEHFESQNICACLSELFTRQYRRGIYNAGLPCLTEEGNAGIRKSLLKASRIMRAVTTAGIQLFQLN